MSYSYTREILLIEDNEDDIDLTLRAFHKARISNPVTVLRDGQRAMEYLFSERDPSILPALILLDLRLPKVDGLEILQRIRHDPSTELARVVIMTSSQADEDVLRSYELGACSFIRKPVDFEKFFEAAQAVGCYWMMLNEPPTDPGRTIF